MTNMQKSSEQNLNTALNMVKNNNSKHYVNEINIDGKLFNYNYEDD